MTTPPRPIEAYVHGLAGPLVLIEGAEAVALLGFGGLDAYQRTHRGANTALDRATAKLRLASAAYRSGAAGGTSPAEPAEPAQLCGGRLTSRQVADLAGVTPRAVVKAISEGRLQARWWDGRWLIEPDDAEAYRPAGR